MTKYENEDIKIIGELNYDWDHLKDKTIMISGGTGFIASFLIEVFRYRNKYYHNNISVISLSRGGKPSKDVDYDNLVKYMKVDITKPFICNDKIDFVLHLASNTHPKQYNEDPIGTIITNVVGCHSLLDFSVEKKASRFLLASSVEIYGESDMRLMDESYCGYINCNDARNGYNEAKRTCEALCQSFRKKFGINTVTVRLSRVFGPDKKIDTKAMSQFMLKAVAGEDIVLKSKGNQRYSYCYVADAASAIIKILLDGEDGEAYNVAESDEGLSLGQYAEYIASLSGKNVVYEMEDNDSVSKATYALLDCTKIEQLGWKPQFTVLEGLERTYRILNEHRI